MEDAMVWVRRQPGGGVLGATKPLGAPPIVVDLVNMLTCKNP